MSELNSATFRDFSGGMNRADAPFMVQSNQVFDAQDVLFSDNGSVRRRGPLLEKKARQHANAHSFNADDHMVCMGPVIRVGNNGGKGMFYVTSDPSNTSCRIYFSAGYSWFGGTKYTIVSLVRAMDVYCSIGTIDTGFSPSYKAGGDADENRNALYDSTVIATDAWTVVAKVRRDSPFSGSPTAHQVREDCTITNIDTSGDSVTHTYYFEFTIVADPNLAGSGSPAWTAGDTTPLMRQNDESMDAFPYTATVNGFTFVAGATGSPQKFWFSGHKGATDWLPNAHYWDPDNEIYIESANEAQPIRALAKVAGNLVVLKSESIVDMRVNGDPTTWEPRVHSGVGTLDARSVAYHEDSIIFAARDGVYRYDGMRLQSLTEGKLGNWYRSIVDAWGEGKHADQETDPDDHTKTLHAGWTLVGTVAGDHYLLTFLDQNGDAPTDYDGNEVPAISLHLSNPDDNAAGREYAWSRITNCQLTAVSFFSDTTPTIGAIMGPVESGHRYIKLVDVGRMFTRTGGELDAFGSGPWFSVQFGAFDADEPLVRKILRSIEVAYRVTVKQGSPKLKICLVRSLDRFETNTTGQPADTGSSGLNTENNLRTVTSDSPHVTHSARVRYGHRGFAFRVWLYEDQTYGEDNRFSTVTISALSYYWKNMRKGRSDNE